MTRFEQEISGALGAFWQRNAQQEVERLMAKTSDIEVEEDGAAKWKTNGSYLPKEVIEKLAYGGFDFSPEATTAKREEQTTVFLRDYRRNHRTTEEEKNEMRAVFGAGQTVIDIITGERIAL